MTPVLEVAGLIKRYGDFTAVDGVDCTIAPGEIFGLLGPNGAGKTTTVECVLGLRDADGGSVRICGSDRSSGDPGIRLLVGAQLQRSSLPDRITVREALILFASFYGDPVPVGELLQRFSLEEKAQTRFEHLSGGQQQRLSIALAVVNRPRLLVLDEPTAGLDPQLRREIHGLIRTMRAEGRSVLLTTHYMDEASELCDRIAIIDHGRIIAAGTPAELTARSQGRSRIEFGTARACDRARLAALPTVSAVEVSGLHGRVTCGQVNQVIIALAKLLDEDHNELTQISLHTPTLEDVFLELTGHGLRD